jgi:hypothetical protein
MADPVAEAPSYWTNRSDLREPEQRQRGAGRGDSQREVDVARRAFGLLEHRVGAHCG